NISRFRAVCAVLAGNLGTGNISGMAIALATGGPGALVWMWIMVFFGSVIQFVSCVLGVSYRNKTKSGEYVGGPMYYLDEGLGYRKIAV
ncbi:MAG TPA: sodium:alanine symporter family protein, partial [Parachlamydiales bacterium]|nr:sodium:alanine symporter family protein [Parachlamydiales bacterium]